MAYWDTEPDLLWIEDMIGAKLDGTGVQGGQKGFGERKFGHD